jgi:hypothetical protein
MVGRGWLAYVGNAFRALVNILPADLPRKSRASSPLDGPGISPVAPASGVLSNNFVTVEHTSANLCLVMRRILFSILILATPVRAAEPVSNRSDLLQVTVAKTKDGQPASTFLTGTPKIYGLWKGETLKAGDIIRAVWVAEAFGYSRKDVKITEGTATAYKSNDEGVFSVARPQGGWPLGRYRVEFYVGETLAGTVRFDIEQDVTVEVR